MNPLLTIRQPELPNLTKDKWWLQLRFTRHSVRSQWRKNFQRSRKRTCIVFSFVTSNCRTVRRSANLLCKWRRPVAPLGLRQVAITWPFSFSNNCLTYKWQTKRNVRILYTRYNIEAEKCQSHSQGNLAHDSINLAQKSKYTQKMYITENQMV